MCPARPSRSLHDEGVIATSSSIANTHIGDKKHIHPAGCILDADDVRYTLTTFAVAIAGAPVAHYSITATNTATSPRTAKLALAIADTRGPQVRGQGGITTVADRFERSATGDAHGFFTQPGQAFSPTFIYCVCGRDDVSWSASSPEPAPPSSPAHQRPRRPAEGKSRAPGMHQIQGTCCRLWATTSPAVAAKTPANTGTPPSRRPDSNRGPLHYESAYLQAF